jgi:2-succinyl-5-enolpyruvyl-6-hydroxy-3-cyclohexene-1-carboxylate synthase
MNLQAVFNIAEICARHGIQQVILSPGSRCAPLTLAFSRHPRLQVRTVTDERAAAFLGLGIALATRRPVVLICTSGTAALNYAPAVAEAFYLQVPLFVITADRPPEWIDQLDGQTIRQEQIYGRHVKKSFSFPVEAQHPDANWYSQRLISEALLEAQAFPPGPVHLNIPLREPFYPQPNENITFEPNIKVIHELTNDYTLSTSQLSLLKHIIFNPDSAFKRILVVVGQHPPDEELQEVIQIFAEETGAIIVADVIANLHQLPRVIRLQDVHLADKNTHNGALLQPDLLITFGLSNISKNLKMFLRAFPPLAHWHLQPAGTVADPFQSLTQIIRTSPVHFFSNFASPNIPATKTNSYNKGGLIIEEKFVVNENYNNIWQEKESQARQYSQSYLSLHNFNEFTAYAYVLKNLPGPCHLHLANSMSVRYANIIGLRPDQAIKVYANRGTSGIDGSTSTAVGVGLSTSELNILITGDLAFFYDRNGLWHNYLPPNLRIILLNNHGGGIFRLIDGPRQQPELGEFFETRQMLNAEQSAQDFNLNYFPCNNADDLAQKFPEFLKAGTGILEIFTSSPANAAFFSQFKLNNPIQAK